MSSLKTIQEEWEGFSGMIFAKMAPSLVQREETKRAFFAGAFAILCAMKRIGEPDISEAAGIQFIEEREMEGQAFYRDLIQRYSETN